MRLQSYLWIVGAALCTTTFAQTSQPATRGAPDAIAVRYADHAAKITQFVRNGHDGLRKLEHLCDDIGNRLSGSASLERAIEWAVEQLKRDGHENVRAEPVMVPKWVRGDESCELIEPRRYKLSMLGLGGSVGTPAEGITAPVIVVADQLALSEIGEKAAGKIVLFNAPMSDKPGGGGYGSAVRYRTFGARWGAEHDAAAVLIRSVTTRSLRSPHTGATGYFDAKKRIPAAAISVEDAEMLARLYARGVSPVVTLKMEARLETEQAPSANVVAELRGEEKPDEIVLIGGHIDSWDVGQGALDDGGGCVTAMEALNVLRKLGLRPRRTIRVVLFTNEENGLAGGKAYARQHADELSNHVAAIEHDSGVFTPTGFGVSHEKDDAQARAVARLEAMLPLFAGINDQMKMRSGGGGADIGPMKPAGVPLLGQEVDGTHYFDFHHTHADTFDKIDPQHLTDNIAAMAIMAYVLADMPQRLSD